MPPNTSDSNSGYPIYTVSDIASHGADRQIIPVEQPRIYYGEVIAQADPDYAIVGGPPGSAPREYDTDTSKYTYTGRGGVSIGNWFSRWLFAARYVERNILFSRAIGSESKMFFNRDPKERVQKVAPWLTTDANAYPAVVDGRIVWIIDAYTTLDTYPYAQRAPWQPDITATGVTRSPQEVSYVRNSVKATVDAYDGTVTLYQVDRQDPVLQTWMRTFPGSVKSPDDIPTNCAPTSAIPRICSRFSVSYSPNTMSMSLESSSLPTPSGRCPAIRPMTPSPNSRRSTSSSGTRDRGAVLPTGQRNGRLQPRIPLLLRLGALGSGRLRQNHGAAAAHRHLDPGPAADPELDDLRHPRRIRADSIGAIQPGSLRQLADSADRRRWSPLRGTAYTERISTSPNSSTFPRSPGCWPASENPAAAG